MENDQHHDPQAWFSVRPPTLAAPCIIPRRLLPPIVCRLLSIALTLTLLLPGISGLAQPAGPPALVRIDLRGPGDLDRVAALGLPVHAHLTAPGADYLLAVLPPDQQGLLRSLDLAWTVLDPDARGARYYLIESGRPDVRLAERAAPVFIVLHDDGRHALGRLREGVLPSAVDDVGLATARIGLDPIVLAPRISGLIPTVPLYDPLVADLFPHITDSAVSWYDGSLSGEWSVLIGGQPYTITTRYSYSGEPIAKATQYVYEHLQMLGYEARYHDYTLSGYALRNVIGEKQGLVHPDQIVLLTAHLDSRAAAWPHDPAPGADDNASGSSALLVAADLLADLDFAYTIRLVFFTGEEQGMYGSYYYVRDAFNAGEDIVGVLNLDMIAWDGEGGPDIDLHSHLPSTEDDSDRLADLFAAVVDVYSLALNPQIVEDGTTFSDHSRFWDRGYAAILGIEDYYNAYESPAEPRDWNPNYHTTNDRLSTLNLAYFREYTRAALATFVHLAGPMRVLSGTVTSIATSAPLSATVVATGQDGTFDGTTDGSGAYEISLPTGIYTVTAAASGYISQTFTGVSVLTDTGRILDFALERAVFLPPYAFDVPDLSVRIGEPGERVTHTVTVVNSGEQDDAYDLSLSPSVWTATLSLTRTSVISSQQSVTVPVAVVIPQDAVRGDQDPVTLTVTSVYSPAHTGHVTLWTAVGVATHLPVVLRDSDLSAGS